MITGTNKYRFKVVTGSSSRWTADTIFLLEDNWDDWFTYSTMYQVIVCLDTREKHRIGAVKIGQIGQTKEQRRPEIPNEFSTLDDRFFSIGQDADYYEELNNLGDSLRNQILTSLRDVAANPGIWADVRTLEVTQTSLLRSVSETAVQGQFRRMAHGGARLTEFKFAYTGPKRDGYDDRGLELSFEVRPESFPPTNVHVVIGRNGVGKTHTMNLMTKALVAKKAIAAQSGSFIAVDTNNQISSRPPFSNLVSVCFSAFDSFLLAPDELDPESKIKFSYIGLRRIDDQGNKIAAPKSPDRLATEFVKNAIECLGGNRTSRWIRAVETLEADPIFKSAESKLLIQGIMHEERQDEVRKIFKRLSSGHQIVLLSITTLVATVEEKTLVLLDEPEGHLHPPLLSAFVRAISDLLIDRNGVAVVATHSPVVLQEVPRSCVWKLQRSGTAAIAERPDCQTFGENVGVLTREVFGFEITDSGFHRTLRDVSEREPSYQSAVDKFGDELGAEARAILRGMYLRKDRQDESPS